MTSKSIFLKKITVMDIDNLKRNFSYIISNNTLSDSIIDVGQIVAEKGTLANRKEVISVLQANGIKDLKAFNDSSIKLILLYIKLALKDNVITEEEIQNIRFLKLLLDIEEGDFTKDKSNYNEVLNMINIQMKLMFLDNEIDKLEGIQKIYLQEMFGLGYDEFSIMINTHALDAVERGADWLKMDSFITENEVIKWETGKPAEPDFSDDIDDDRSRHITQSVKDDVWNRDGGVCTQCGSGENLEFDHIIPHSEGGSNTYRNVQLLCQACNRSKSNSIG